MCVLNQRLKFDGKVIVPFLLFSLCSCPFPSLTSCALWYLSPPYSSPARQPPGVIFPMSFSPFLPSSLSSSPSLCLLRWSFYRISLRSSPLSLMCSIKDAPLRHPPTPTPTHTQSLLLPQKVKEEWTDTFKKGEIKWQKKKKPWK